MVDKSLNCPCASGKSYNQCCHPLHNGEAHAESAEQLMRSRFSAFFLGCRGEHALANYLIDTHHPSQHQADDKAGLRDNFNQQQWLSLVIRDSGSDRKTPNQAWVEFCAFFSLPHQPDTPQQLHERSSFIMEDGRWYYLSGEWMKGIQLGRNDRCWCGSGKKLKQCHQVL